MSTSSPVPDTIRKNLEWYIANQKELSAQYNGKILLIVNQELIRAFDSNGEAYSAATKDYAIGTFTLQQCSPDPESYTLMLYSPAFGLAA